MRKQKCQKVSVNGHSIDIDTQWGFINLAEIDFFYHPA
jgi:hypothetical protein